MERDRIGGGFVAALGVCAPWIADMMGLTVTPRVGYALLAACVLLTFCGLWLLFRKGDRALSEEDKKRGAAIHISPIAKGTKVHDIWFHNVDNAIENHGENTAIWNAEITRDGPAPPSNPIPRWKRRLLRKKKS